MGLPGFSGSDQMKLAILTEILSTHSGSRAPIELAKYLSLNNEVTLLAYSFSAEKEIKKDLEKRGVRVILIDAPDIPLGKWLAAFKFLPHLQENKLISFHGTLPTFLVAKLAGLPLVQTYYGTQLDAYLEKLLPSQKPSLKDKFLNWLGNQLVLLIQKIYFGLSNQVVAISNYTSREARKLYGRKIPFIHLGASVESFRATRSKTARSAAVNILSVSRITPYKGFHLLMEGVKKTGRRVNLFIVGSASQPEYLAYLKKNKSPRTKILIDVSDQELVSLYQNCDIYASCDRYLFFGLPPLEAALSGKPSVVLDYCAAQEIVAHQKTGFIAKNLGEFTKYLKLLIDNPVLRAKMGREAKVKAEKNFSWEKTAGLYEQLFAKTAR